MAAPKGSIFGMRKKYLSSSKSVTGMARHSDFTARDRLKNAHHRKYHNESLLSASRVHQVFGFDVHTGDYWGDEVEDSMGEYELELDDSHYRREGEQLELELETIDELEGRFRTMMRRYESAIHAMAADALQWHDLMCDIEEDEHLEKEFNKFQMLRKLSGGTM